MLVRIVAFYCNLKVRMRASNTKLGFVSVYNLPLCRLVATYRGYLPEKFVHSMSNMENFLTSKNMPPSDNKQFSMAIDNDDGSILPHMP